MHRAAGYAVADGDIAVLVHGDAAHPAVAAVRSEGALLEHRRRRVRATHFIPAYPSAAAGGDGVIDHDRLMVAEVPVGIPVHEPVGERVELRRRPRLRNTDATAARFGEARHADVSGTGEARGAGVGEIR